MKKILALLLAVAMIASLVACGGEKAPATDPAPQQGGEETPAPAEGLKVAISLAEYNEWNKNYEKVIKEKCDEWGWTYEIFDAKQDANKQIDDVRSVINQGFNAMTIQAVDMAIPGFASQETLLYSPELKFYSNKVKMDADLNTNVANLHCLGDSSGWTRGLMMASVMGVALGRKIY